MHDDSQSFFAFPAVGRKKVTAAFDGGRLTSDGGVMLFAQAERNLGLSERLAVEIADARDPGRIVHTVSSILKARILAIACGYEDGNDLDSLRSDPAFKLACGQLPQTGFDLCSQPTVSRWENAPTLKELIRLMGVMADLYCESYKAPPEAVTLDIDDTVDVVHGHQQLSLFNAHEDERCFKPIHVYDVATGRPVMVLLRPGKTPSGKEVRGHLRRLVRHIRRHWPDTRLTIRGDSHYGRPEVMEWCENNAVDYIFALAGTEPLAAKVEEAADAIRVERAEKGADATRGFAETLHAAKSWKVDRRVAARIEATPKGLDIRYVVTNLKTGTPQWLYAGLYCRRGQAENLIKLHKGQLKSDRTSCRSPLANQMRLILHTAAYWLMLSVRDAIPKTEALAKADFNSLRLRLVKIGARVIETASRVRIAFAAACPEASLFRSLASTLNPAAP
jgi:Transposase DDE domain group 1